MRIRGLKDIASIVPLNISQAYALIRATSISFLHFWQCGHFSASFEMDSEHHAQVIVLDKESVRFDALSRSSSSFSDQLQQPHQAPSESRLKEAPQFGHFVYFLKIHHFLYDLLRYCYHVLRFESHY